MAFVSPGVYVYERDLSDYTPGPSPCVPGIVGFASQGPVDKPVLITSPGQLEEIFGLPNEYTGGQGLWSAFELLKETNSLYYVRAAASDAVAASAQISAGGCAYTTVTVTAPTTTDAIRFDVAVSGGVDGSALHSGKYSLIVPAVTDIYKNIADVIALAMPTDTPFWFDETTKAFVSKYPGWNSVLSVSSYTWSGTAAALASQGGSQGSFGGTTDSPSVYAADYEHGTGAADNPIDNGWGASALMKGSPNVWNASGTLASGTLSATSVGTGTFFDVTVPAGGTYVVKSLHSGAGYNYQTSYNRRGVTESRGIQVTVDATGRTDGLQNIRMYRGGGAIESHEVAYLSSNDGSKKWVEDQINSYTYLDSNRTSELIRGRFLSTAGSATTWIPAEVMTYGGSPSVTAKYNSGWNKDTWHGSNSKDGLASVTAKFTNFPALMPGTYNLSAGVNGSLETNSYSWTAAAVKNALIGNASHQTGMRAFTDPTVFIDVLLMPGITNETLVNNALAYTEETKMWLFLTSPPVGLSTAQRAVNFHNGVGEGRNNAINSNYGAMYWPWVKIFNRFTGLDEYLDPAVIGASVICRTDEMATLWTAPAGFRRGRVTNAVDVESRLTQGDRDHLYSYGNSINPIVQFPGEGVVVFGQRTLQRAATALDRINVRRLAVHLRKQILKNTRRFAFEPNDPITWSQVVRLLNQELQGIKDQRGLVSYTVVCDETTNTSDRIERGELWTRVNIVPTKAAEILVFELNVLGQNVEATEVLL